MQKYEVEYFDGQTPDSQLTSAEFDSMRGCVKLASKDGLLQFRFEELMIEEVSNNFFIVNLKNSEAYFSIHLSDPTYFHTIGLKYKKIGTKKNKLTGVSIGLIILTALVIGLIKGSAPLSKYIAANIPLSTEKKLFHKIAMTTFENSICKSHPSLENLNAIKNIIVGNATISGDIEVHVVDSSIVNAFALPGGSIVMTTEILKLPDDQIIGVLAHEIAHVKQRHILRELIRATIFSSIMGLLLGDASAFLVVDPQTVSNLIALNYSRKQESEADQTALKLLDNSRIDHTGLIRFFERGTATSQLKKQKNLAQSTQKNEGLEKIASIFSTHPITSDRIDQLSAYLRIRDVDPDALKNLTVSQSEKNCTK